MILNALPNGRYDVYYIDTNACDSDVPESYLEQMSTEDRELIRLACCTSIGHGKRFRACGDKWQEV